MVKSEEAESETEFRSAVAPSCDCYNGVMDGDAISASLNEKRICEGMDRYEGVITCDLNQEYAEINKPSQAKPSR